MRKYLDPTTIARIGNLQLVARMVVEGAISGQHKSPWYGFNVEFSDHRQYMPGDELRHIDWKLFAKSDRHYVKQYEESTNLKAYLLLDRSASMAFGGGAMSKLFYGKCLVAALSYLMLHQQDSVGVATFSAELGRLVPPRSNPSHLHRILEAIDELQGEGETSLFAVAERFAQQVRRRACVILISDFLDDPEETLRGVRFLRYLKHEVILLHVIAPEEEDFPYQRVTRFVDLEDGSELVIDPKLLAQAYRERVRDFTDHLARESRHHKLDYVRMRTDRPLEEALAEFLGSRARRRR